MTNKDIILHELTSDEISAGKPFAHFGWEGGKEFSFMCISDGYWESAKIILITTEQIRAIIVFFSVFIAVTSSFISCRTFFSLEACFQSAPPRRKGSDISEG